MEVEVLEDIDWGFLGENLGFLFIKEERVLGGKEFSLFYFV